VQLPLLMLVMRGLINLINMLYKTLYLANNPNAEYQRRNGVWFKRPIGTKQIWVKVNTEGQRILSNVYKDKNALFYYSNTALILGVSAIGLLGYMYYRKKKGLTLLPKFKTTKTIV
jgi:hypothetical protein